jgi:hypothetical protein
MENLVKIAKERNELHQGSAWWELKENLKFHTADEVDYRMIDVMWKQAELDDGLDKWDEQFLNAVSGEYKTQQQLEQDKAIQQLQMQQRMYQNAQQAQLHQAGAVYPGGVYPVTSTSTSGAGLFKNLFGGAGK